jgi:hypothetical protein
MVAVGGSGDLLDRHADEEIPGVAVPASLARRKIRWLVSEVREMIPRPHDRVDRIVDPQRVVALTGFLVRVVGDPGGVREQVPHGHLGRDRRAGQVDDLGDRLILV